MSTFSGFRKVSFADFPRRVQSSNFFFTTVHSGASVLMRCDMFTQRRYTRLFSVRIFLKRFLCCLVLISSVCLCASEVKSKRLASAARPLLGAAQPGSGVRMGHTWSIDPLHSKSNSYMVSCMTMWSRRVCRLRVYRVQAPCAGRLSSRLTWNTLYSNSTSTGKDKNWNCAS